MNLRSLWSGRPKRWAWPLWACTIVAVCGWGFVRLERQDEQIRDLIHRDAVEDEVDEAQQCAEAWARAEGNRDGIGRAAIAGAEALIAVADAEPARIEAYRAAIAQQAELARAEVEDPDCDLDRAQRVLDDK